MAATINYTESDISVFVVSIMGQALNAFNNYMGLIVLLGVLTGIAGALYLLIKTFKGIGHAGR